MHSLVHWIETWLSVSAWVLVSSELLIWVDHILVRVLGVVVVGNSWSTHLSVWSWWPSLRSSISSVLRWISLVRVSWRWSLRRSLWSSLWRSLELSLVVLVPLWIVSWRSVWSWAWSVSLRRILSSWWLTVWSWNLLWSSSSGVLTIRMSLALVYIWVVRVLRSASGRVWVASLEITSWSTWV